MPQNLNNENWEVNIDSGNGLLPEGNKVKPLPGPILTQVDHIYIIIWCHQAPMSKAASHYLNQFWH